MDTHVSSDQRSHHQPGSYRELEEFEQKKSNESITALYEKSSKLLIQIFSNINNLLHPTKSIREIVHEVEVLTYEIAKKLLKAEASEVISENSISYLENLFTASIIIGKVIVNPAQNGLKNVRIANKRQKLLSHSYDKICSTMLLLGFYLKRDPEFVNLHQADHIYSNLTELADQSYQISQLVCMKLELDHDHWEREKNLSVVTEVLKQRLYDSHSVTTLFEKKHELVQVLLRLQINERIQTFISLVESQKEHFRNLLQLIEILPFLCSKVHSDEILKIHQVIAGYLGKLVYRIPNFQNFKYEMFSEIDPSSSVVESLSPFEQPPFEKLIEPLPKAIQSLPEIQHYPKKHHETMINLQSIDLIATITWRYTSDKALSLLDSMWTLGSSGEPYQILSCIPTSKILLHQMVHLEMYRKVSSAGQSSTEEMALKLDVIKVLLSYFYCYCALIEQYSSDSGRIVELRDHFANVCTAHINQLATPLIIKNSLGKARNKKINHHIFPQMQKLRTFFYEGFENLADPLYHLRWSFYLFKISTIFFAEFKDFYLKKMIFDFTDLKVRQKKLSANDSVDAIQLFNNQQDCLPSTNYILQLIEETQKASTLFLR